MDSYRHCKTRIEKTRVEYTKRKKERLRKRERERERERKREKDRK
jgi:hypothetical protein